MTQPTIEFGHGSLVTVNGVQLYHEVHGSGRPLILLHGGLMSGETMAGLVAELAASHTVILPDLQGHGRTPDVPGRPLDVRLMADDILALIDHLGLDRPDLVGYSLGGGVAMQVAFKRPDRVGRLVACSTNIRRDAIYPEMLGQQEQVSAAAAEFMKETPMWELYERVAPRPEDFPTVLDKIGEAMRQDFDFSDQVRALQVPTLIVCGDSDMAPPSHYVEIFGLLGGGQRDGGWMGEGRPAGGHQLLVLPGRTHYDASESALFAAAVLAFLEGAAA
jgi:pimeloyl-ACP methyl ester carboxylesterase